jgi:hypothetical protein
MAATLPGGRISLLDLIANSPVQDAPTIDLEWEPFKAKIDAFCFAVRSPNHPERSPRVLMILD